MGICISRKLTSLEIHESEITSEENAVYYGENDGVAENRKIGSLYSQQGTNETNQDTAIICKFLKPDLRLPESILQPGRGYGVEGGTFCGVFDGHGKNGHKVSRLARNRLPSLILNLKNALVKLNMDTDTYQDSEMESKKSFYRWREACVSAFKVIDKELTLDDSFDYSCSGSTAVIVIKQGEDLVIVNLGDSRAMLGTVTDEGVLKAVQLTTDLKPNLPREEARILRNKGRVSALKEEPRVQSIWSPHMDSHGLAMSRAFGNFSLKEHGLIAIPDIYYKCVAENDLFIVLASDGVWDVMSNDDVAKIVLEAGSEVEAAKAVVDAAVSTWKRKRKCSSSRIDDCTAVCLFLQ